MENQWAYSDRELVRIKENAGELYQLTQILVWNSCDLLDRPEEKIVFKNHLEELENLLYRIACGK